LENNTDCFSREVRVTDERLAHIVERPDARHVNRELPNGYRHGTEQSRRLIDPPSDAAVSSTRQCYAERPSHARTALSTAAICSCGR
jgi:hypothetical protein